MYIKIKKLQRGFNTKIPWTPDLLKPQIKKQDIRGLEEHSTIDH